MATVVKRENESTEQLIKRFKKAVINEGIMDELRKRDYYVAKSLKRKLKHKAAVKRDQKLQKERPIDSAYDY